MTQPAVATLASPGLDTELPLRLGRVAAALTEAGASCLVAVRDESVNYLTGYTTMTWRMHSRPVVAVVDAIGRLFVVAAETEVDSARLRIPGADVRSYVELDPVTPQMRLPDGVVQFAPHAARVLAEVIEEAGSDDVLVDGLEAAWPPVGQPTRLIPALDGRTRDGSELVWRLRMHKSPWEVERMRVASAVLDRAYAVLREQVRPGLTEREISRLFSIAQLEAGAYEVGAHAVVAGPGRGLFGWPTDKVWTADELLYVDGASIVDGYWSDYCRTFAARPVTRDEAEGYARVRAGLTAALDAFTVSMSAGELGSLMGKAMAISPNEVGFGRFGHGIGLHVPEVPSLHPGDTTLIGPGTTMCIEPTVRHAGVNFVVEEEHVVTASGLERISPHAPEEIIIL